ncbi:MAG: alpha/beta hydrolase [Synechococcaceae cyanobacterium]|nr:alpha/beta hydrolase [Synechococcaceae cyanobacterium]
MTAWTSPVPVPPRLHSITAALASLLIAAAGGRAAAAEVLELRLDGLSVPIRIDQLEEWSRRAGQPVPHRRGRQEVGVWLDLLDPESRTALAGLLRTPLLRDRSFGRQLLDSWAGGPMLAEVGDLLTTPDGRSTSTLLQETLRRLLEERREVNALQLLQALPEPRLSLQLDRLLALADQWRHQLERQRLALELLRRLPLPPPPAAGTQASSAGQARPHRRRLAVPHRPDPLPVDLWLPDPRPAGPAPAGAAPPAARPWVLMMPGLGGDAGHLGWMAGALAARGWPVAVLEHPGSDAEALRSALEGRRPPPGAESLAVRVDDARAVLAAQRQGALPVHGEGVVLVGHSLGAVNALLTAGLAPEPGLGERCRSRVERLPLTNPSWLLQCQLPRSGLPAAAAAPAGLRGMVLLNGFGSLFWPRRALEPLGVPVLMVGGSLDLVTPPLEEQLALFLPAGDPRSRLVLVEGGSHFSPVRMDDPGEAVLRLGEELVGVNPETVQALLLTLTTDFLETLGEPRRLAPQKRTHRQAAAYVLDGPAARRWKAGLPR